MNRGEKAGHPSEAHKESYQNIIKSYQFGFYGIQLLSLRSR